MLTGVYFDCVIYFKRNLPTILHIPATMITQSTIILKVPLFTVPVRSVDGQKHSTLVNHVCLFKGLFRTDTHVGDDGTTLEQKAQARLKIVRVFY